MRRGSVSAFVAELTLHHQQVKLRQKAGTDHDLLAKDAVHEEQTDPCTIWLCVWCCRVKP